MGTPLRCLLVEDSESDARLIVRALRNADFEVDYERVETAGQLRVALEEQIWDVVIADYRMPEFSAPNALALLQQVELDLPFIVISGAIGEQTAVEMMRAGAADYMMKGDLARLGPAIERELGDAKTRRQRRQAQDELRESEERFRSVVEGSPEGIYVATQGRFRYLNRAAVALFGADSTDQLLGQPVLERVHPDLRAKTVQGIQGVDELGIASPISERKYLKLDGTVLDVEGCAVPFFYEGQKGGLVFFRDITERKRAEEALRESEERFRSVVESAPEAIYVSTQGRFRYINPAALRLYGAVSEAELVGQPVLERVHPDFRARVTGRMQRVDELRTASVPSEKKYIKLDGTVFDAEGCAVPFNYEGQQGGLAFFHDISERKRAELALRESEARFRSVVESAPEAIYVSTHGHFRYLNPAAVKLFGAVSESELVGQPVLERVHPDFRAEVAERIRLVDDLRMAAPSSARKYLRLDGTTIDVESSGVPYIHEGENRSLVFLRDITDRARHESEREAMITLLSLCNAPTSQRELIRTVSGFLQKWSGCEAVGIRLSEGDDFPYYETRGFPPHFVLAESPLCAREAGQEPLRDSQGNPVLDCMCGNVLCGRFDPSLPFFTQSGSFWTNSTSELLASTTEADRQSCTRNRCSGEGYESVALIRLAFASHTIGLLQFNDKRKGRFTPGLLEFLERVAGTLATALEQRFAQAAQWESEARYRSLFENMREAYAYCKIEFDGDKPRDYVHLSVNSAFGKLTGLKGVVGRRASEVVPGVHESNPELLEICGRVSLSGMPETFETYVPALGSWLSIAVYGVSRGHFVVVFDNITERKQAQEKLRASEERYRLIADNSTDVIWTLDLASGRITYVSPAVRQLRGYSPEEVLAQSLEDMMTPESYRHATTVLAERTARLESGDESARTVCTELEHPRKDGSIVPTEMVATLLTDERGHVTGIVGVSRDITERKRTEAALRESEERAHFLADTLDRGSQPFAIAYPDGRMGSLNAAFCNLVGYSPDELRTLSWTADLTPPEWREVTAASLGTMCIEGNPVRYEKEYLRKDGSRVSVEVFAHLIRDSAGVPSHYFAFFTDLTERKRAQQALRESEQRYRELFENSPLGIYRTTPGGRFLLANPALLTMLGYKSLEELADLNLEEEGFESEYDRGWFKDTIERDGTIRNHEAQWKLRDGKTVYFRENARGVRDSNGAVLYYDGTIEDITARKRIADAFRRSEERFRQVAEDAGVFVWEVDAEGLYTYATPVVQTILGYSPDELVGKLHYYDLFAPKDREELKAIANEAFAQRRSIFAFLTSNVRKDGAIVVLETSGTPLLDAAGNLLGYRGTDRDVTDRARATEELRRHRDNLEELVSARTAELAAKNLKLADEVFARTLAAEALKQSEARLQLQLNCMPMACLTLGLDSRIRSWNPGAAQVFGYSPEEAIGVSIADLLVPGDIRAEIQARIGEALRGDHTLHGVNDNSTKDGRRIACEWTNTPLVDSEGGGVGLLCMAQDITARRNAEEALRVRAQELETFNRAMVGREKRLIELKEEINRLCAELGRPPAYPPVWNGVKQ